MFFDDSQVTSPAKDICVGVGEVRREYMVVEEKKCQDRIISVGTYISI